ncbi:uncharacterized protein LOC129598600 [Paramacrobiotus metropolitanus]|uniref:uncharacterized protein LOC129598600 n=1 Tax=Paramacrobiotus metropolitanus TaxID=2943436 RepID=UPI002445EEBB|nr:uncharacterized protein LOC129598600 [Paramacrobiotus metropolitanus]
MFLHNTIMKAAIAVVVILLTVQVCYGKSSPSEDEVLLELFCRGIYVLPCPDTTEIGDRAGRLRFYHVPKSNCSVKLTTPSNCNSKSAIYLHVPVSYLGESQTVRIYERIDGKSTLVKQIPGGKSYNMPNNAIESIAQLVSSYQKAPSLTINMDLGPERKENPYHEIIFDYTVLTQKPKPDEVLCQALKGYIPRNILCDASDTMRVSCPEAYMSRTDPNSVMSVQSCDASEDPVIDAIGDPPVTPSVTKKITPSKPPTKATKIAPATSKTSKRRGTGKTSAPKTAARQRIPEEPIAVSMSNATHGELSVG